MSTINHRTAVLLVVEKGYIEQQAKLLIKSILRLNDINKLEVDVFTFSPRKNFKPGAKTQEFLKHHVTNHFNENLNTEYERFPLINGHIGASFFEQNYPEYKHVMLLDTDTVFLQDFSSFLNIKNTGIFISPVDNKGVGSSGESDKNHEFWKRLYYSLSIDPPTHKVVTTVGQEMIWPYYNAGFVYAKNIPAFFTQWLENFKTIYASDVRSVYAGKNGSKSIYLEQVALALTAQQHRELIIELPKSFNYPIPFHPRLKHRHGALGFKDLIHLHYHRWFQHPGFLDHVTSDEDKKSEQYLWLKEQLPLKPVIDDQFKC